MVYRHALLMVLFVLYYWFYSSSATRTENPLAGFTTMMIDQFYHKITQFQNCILSCALLTFMWAQDGYMPVPAGIGWAILCFSNNQQTQLAMLFSELAGTAVSASCSFRQNMLVR